MEEEDQKALEAQALDLSLRYSFVTPLTSMVVTKPSDQQQKELANKPTEAGKNSPPETLCSSWLIVVDFHLGSFDSDVMRQMGGRSSGIDFLSK